MTGTPDADVATRSQRRLKPATPLDIHPASPECRRPQARLADCRTEWQVHHRPSPPLLRVYAHVFLSPVCVAACTPTPKSRRIIVSRPLPRRCGVCNAPTACWKAAAVSSSIHGAALQLPRLCRACDSRTAAAPFDPSMLAAILQRRCTTSRARSVSVAITGLALTSTSSACGPRSLPPFAYPFCFFPPSPPSLRHSPHLPHFWSHFFLPTPPLVANPLRNRVDSPMPAGVVCSCALPV
jgi:hypothetical protein